jgi:aromatic-L-amino-acid decarboxylase
MDLIEFRRYAHELVEWMADYLEQVGTFPVRSSVKPREIIHQIPVRPPQKGEPFGAVFNDFKNIIMPGMTHWQSPSFFAYFPANNSPASILAEMLTATMGAQCMSWVTSPAATELEERMMDWLREMIGLPGEFSGVIQDTASTATLCSLLTAREVKSGYSVNQMGFAPSTKFTVYSSREAHSSIEKAVKIAGLGRENLRKIEVDDTFAMVPAALESAIVQDVERGYTPLCVIAATGTTGSTATDPIRPIGEICQRYNVWMHVDAAFAGSALILPEKRWMVDGVDYADTFVFNPHKWLMTNFDCSAYFVKNTEALVKTFEILPEYLKTSEGERVNNYRDWGLQLGRRFRALKLWFVIRTYGIEGLQEKLRRHLTLAATQVERIRATTDFELLAPVPLNTICFRYHPSGVDGLESLNRINAEILERVNQSGGAFLTHTKLKGVFAIRMVIGQTMVQDGDVVRAWQLLQDTARTFST